jgi:hypothetical protein
MHEMMEGKTSKRWSRGAAGGVILILVGLAALLARFTNIGSYLVLLLGVSLLVWGVISRTGGGIIPGGVLAGIGLGVLVNQGPWRLSPDVYNGLFLLCFAFGWLLITLLSKLVLKCTFWWPLIPGGIMAFLGAAVILGAENFASWLWPAGLIIIGIILIWRWSQARLQ